MNLKKKLDNIFSKYIRLRDSQNGFGRCVTCGRIKPWKDADCGHYIKRQHLAIRYDETNCNLQCKACNCFEQGANERYKIAIDEKWGDGTSDKLEIRKHNRVKCPSFWYEMQIKYYQQKVRELESIQ